MTSHPSDRPVSALRTRMIEDMTVRGFNGNTRGNYIRNVRAFAAFIGRSPGTATAEDLRRFQLHQTQSGMQPPSINSAVSALRFLFTVTLDRPDPSVPMKVRHLSRGIFRLEGAEGSSHSCPCSRSRLIQQVAPSRSVCADRRLYRRHALRHPNSPIARGDGRSLPRTSCAS